MNKTMFATSNLIPPAWSGYSRIKGTQNGMYGSSAIMCIAAATPEWVRDLENSMLEMLEGLRSPNWNGRGEKEANAASYTNAIKLIADLSKLVGIRKPHPTLSPTGNFAFCWDDGKTGMDLEVLPDGSFVFSYWNDVESVCIDEKTDDARRIAELLTYAA